MGDALTKSGNCNGGRPQGPHPAIEPYCPRKTQKNDAQVVESRGKLLPKTDTHAVKSRCQKRCTSRGKSWKAAAKNDAQAVESCCQKRCTSRGKPWKAAAKNDAHAVESRCQKRYTCREKPWKAAAKNDTQVVESRRPNRWYKVVKEQWIATNLIMISPMHNEPATHFSVEVRGWFVFKARRSTFQNARGADRLLSMPQSGAQGV